jgi:hypothetical protein
VRRFVALALVAAAASCAKELPQAPQGQAPSRLRPVSGKAPDDTLDRQTIMSLAHGATIVSRTGELLLENSALRIIDGDPLSVWMPPPSDVPQTITIGLPARTRIEKIGVRSDEIAPANHLQFEVSTDGAKYSPLATLAIQRTIEPQWFDVPPAEATHLRMTAVDSYPGRQVSIRSLLAQGAELEPARTGDLNGCWSVNGTRAQFQRKGAYFTGNLALENAAMELDGGFDGRVYRFNWVRGNDYGFAMLTVAADGRTFSGIEWHEEAIPLFVGDSWFGSKGTCGATALTDIRERYLQRAGRYSLFGLRFDADGNLDNDASAATIEWLARFAQTHPVQLIGWEFRRGNPAANRQFANRELASVIAELERRGVTRGSVTFVAKGSDDPRQVPGSDTARVLYSTIDVEIRRTGSVPGKTSTGR